MNLEDTDIERLWARNEKIKNGIPVGSTYADKNCIFASKNGKSMEEEFPPLFGDV